MRVTRACNQGKQTQQVMSAASAQPVVGCVPVVLHRREGTGSGTGLACTCDITDPNQSVAGVEVVFSAVVFSTVAKACSIILEVTSAASLSTW